MNRLPSSFLLRTFLRSLVLQASWNFERLQSLGALYVLAPALQLYYQGADRVAAFKRYLGYFNTHPYLAPAVLGAILDLEEKSLQGSSPDVSGDEFRKMIMAPFAAMGDALFWGGIRPLAAVIALFFAFHGSLLAPLVFLILFNLPHLMFRIAGFYQGYREGLEIVVTAQRLRLPDLAIRIKEATVVLLGGLCAYQFCAHLKQADASRLWALSALPLVVLLGFLSRKGMSTLLMVWVLTALAVLAVCWLPEMQA